MVTKRINGKTFKLAANGMSTKREAVKLADHYRSMGFLARVHDSGYAWTVWVKEKIYRTSKNGKRFRITR